MERRRTFTLVELGKTEGQAQGQEDIKNVDVVQEPSGNEGYGPNNTTLLISWPIIGISCVFITIILAINLIICYECCWKNKERTTENKKYDPDMAQGTESENEAICVNDKI